MRKNNKFEEYYKEQKEKEHKNLYPLFRRTYSNLNSFEMSPTSTFKNTVDKVDTFRNLQNNSSIFRNRQKTNQLKIKIQNIESWIDSNEMNTKILSIDSFKSAVEMYMKGLDNLNEVMIWLTDSADWKK